MASYTPNFNLYKPANTDPHGDFVTEFANNMDIIDAHLGSGGHTIVDENGTEMPQEGKLQFTGGVQVSDDNVNGATVVNVSGGNGLILGALIYAEEEKLVGVWTDKKPLYKKTWFFNSIIVINANTWTSLGISAGDIENVVMKETVDDEGRSNTVNYCGVRNSYISAYSNLATNIQVLTLYYTKTTDVAGSGGFQAYGFTPVIYSDTERVIGVWRDNKPLYQRSWTGTKSTSSDEIIINDPPSIDTLANSFVTIKGSTGSQIAQYYRDSNDRARIWLEGGKIHMDSGASYPIMPYTYTVTLQYTKTTDSAGSGDYNTLGVPTVHYSTDEQVIGTYFGKPLYQITVDVPSPVNDSNEHLVDLTTLSIEECPYLFGHAVRHSGANDITYYANSIETDGWYYFKARYDNFRSSIMYICLFKNDSISRMRFTIQYTKTTDT